MLTALIEAIRHVADMIHEHTWEMVKFDNEWLAYNKARDEQHDTKDVERIQQAIKMHQAHIRAEHESQKTLALMKEVEILRSLSALGKHEEVLLRAGVVVAKEETMPDKEEQQEEVSNPDGRD